MVGRYHWIMEIDVIGCYNLYFPERYLPNEDV